MSAYWNSGASSIFFNVVTPTCQTCTNPEYTVMKRQKLIEMLEEARKLTHPDVNSGKRATEITAMINSCLDEIRR